jgi:hypothetical protein
MSNDNLVWRINNGKKWECVQQKQSDGKPMINWGIVQNKLIREVQAIARTHPDNFMPDDGTGHIQAIQAVMVRLNCFRDERGWSNLTFAEVMARSV